MVVIGGNGMENEQVKNVQMKKQLRKATKIKMTKEDRIFSVVTYTVLSILMILMIYPFIYVLSTSISQPSEVMKGSVWLLPKGFDLTAYKQMIGHPLFLSSYKNTILYAVVGTILTLIFTALTAYPLSREKFKIRGFISKFYLVTMFFGGGMIPTYIAMKNLHLVDTFWVMVIPGAVSAWNVILMRSFFKTIPESLHESAYLDGASDFQVLGRIVVPLSKPIFATIGLFTMVGHWNNFFSGLLYLNDSNKYPLQLILRNILFNASFTANSSEVGAMADMMQYTSTESLKAASIVITMLPIMCIYPFVQKYFVKGVMIGSIKG